MGQLEPEVLEADEVQVDGFREVMGRLFEAAEKGRGRTLGPLEVADLVEGFAKMAGAMNAGFQAMEELEALKQKKGLWKPR